MLLYYFALKFAFFFMLVHSFVKYEPLQRHWLFLSLLYTAGVAFLSWVFLMAPRDVADWRPWETWLAVTGVISALYFRLLARFDEGVLFWLLLIVGVAVV